MTADIELLPLHLLEAFSQALKGERGELDAWLEVNNEADVRLHVDAYTRANVAHATAAKDAEIEALRAEVAKRVECFADRAEKLEARAERLAEALRWAERHCPCGARPESPDTHPHMPGCPIGDALLHDQEE